MCIYIYTCIYIHVYYTQYVMYIVYIYVKTLWQNHASPLWVPLCGKRTTEESPSGRNQARLTAVGVLKWTEIGSALTCVNTLLKVILPRRKFGNIWKCYWQIQNSNTSPSTFLSPPSYRYPVKGSDEWRPDEWLPRQDAGGALPVGFRRNVPKTSKNPMFEGRNRGFLQIFPSHPAQTCQFQGLQPPSGSTSTKLIQGDYLCPRVRESCIFNILSANILRYKYYIRKY